MEAGFHQIPSLPGFMATIACPKPTATAPVGSSRNSEPSLPVGVCAPTAVAAIAAATTLKRSRLIDQHDWNVVAHGVAQSAFVAQERLFLFAILELPLAPGARQDFQ